jgi:hypothetical protein
MNWELRTGRWEDALADVIEVDAIITDPPYSQRTHAGHDDGANLANRAGKGWKRDNGGVDAFRARREISYTHWTAEEVFAFVQAWAPRCRGWFVALSDSDLCLTWREAYESVGLTGFQPLPILIPGMTVRMSGDGPSSWAVYANVARPKALSKWGTLDGGWSGPQGEREHIGGKPLWIMKKLVQQYSKPGDLVCDPCAGMGTTLLASVVEGRHAIGAEVNPSTAANAIARIKRDYTPELFSVTLATRTCPRCSGTFRIDAFAQDRSSVTGRQSWCRRCKADWECGPEGSWKRLRAWLEKNEPNSLKAPHGWTEERYLKAWKDSRGECSLCGSRLREWQTSGHNLDRIDNNTPHIPANCRMLCWPCNRKKSNLPTLAADTEIGRWVEQYGRGKVPWQILLPNIQRVDLPDMEQYRVLAEPEQRDLFGGAA